MNLRRFAILLFLSFLLLCSARLVAGPPSFTTTDLFNGRMWQLLSATQKLSHLTGIHEGIILCLNQIKTDLKIPSDLMSKIQDSGIFDRRRLLFSSQGITTIEALMNQFYEDSSNLDIPIIDAYQHITMELNFTTPEDLKNNLTNLRRKYKD
ncbi:MAG: hypothetical protein HKO68_16130 [Desulfobacterales bacterium]|nr:hypothetical protein [Desulfobacterales bacterium]